MARAPVQTIDPAQDAAALLRRLALAVLTIATPSAGLLGHHALIATAAIGIVMLVVAAGLDQAMRPVAASLRQVAETPVFMLTAALFGWAALSLLWSPFGRSGVNHWLTAIGGLGLGIAGYAALPDRMRSANLYLVPVSAAAIAALSAVLALAIWTGMWGTRSQPVLELTLIMLVLLAWPALAWLRSRRHDREALALALLITVAVALGSRPGVLAALVLGAVAFAGLSVAPRRFARALGWGMAWLVVLAPLVPLPLYPAARALFGRGIWWVERLGIWREIVINEPARLITGHGFDAALRGRFVGLLHPNAPESVLFSIWYELGLVGALLLATVLIFAMRGAARSDEVLRPGIAATIVSGFALACFGIGLAQVWWMTMTGVVGVILVALARGQFRTSRPRATLHPGGRAPAS